MPRLEAFPAVSQGWINQIAAVVNASVRDAIEEGAKFMREGILDSPTGDPNDWHLGKNQSNSFPSGARIGNLSSTVGEIDPNSGLMLASVSTAGPVKQASAITGFFGWIDVKKQYFLDQDTGAYGVGAEVGMGLLNSGSGKGGVLRDYGAAVASQQSLIKSLKAAGLKHNDLGGAA
jgi:hypothetical protein